MITSQQKLNRYDFIEQALINRLYELRQNLAHDLHCPLKSIPQDEWQEYVFEHMKKPLNDLLGNQDVAYYLFDKIIEENTGILSVPPKKIMKILQLENTGVRLPKTMYH
ncbi:MAG: hypothetical protein IJY58_05515 [Alphaproteobacteria bacterium]|nr:hypothetical protein [Alphaproteobacteria bacterium]